MKNKKSLMFFLLLGIFSFAHAHNGEKDGNPGCDGGTKPASDGKFYTPDGKPCNPSEQDKKQQTR